jgi:hypothetical protein
MNVDELTQYLEDNKERVKDAVFKNVVDSLTRQVEWSLPKKMQEDFDAFYAEDIRPAVKQHMSDNKEAIMQLVVKSCLEAGESISKAMAERIQKTMASDYDSRKVFESLFKS